MGRKATPITGAIGRGSGTNSTIGACSVFCENSGDVCAEPSTSIISTRPLSIPKRASYTHVSTDTEFDLPRRELPAVRLALMAAHFLSLRRPSTPHYGAQVHLPRPRMRSSSSPECLKTIRCLTSGSISSTAPMSLRGLLFPLAPPPKLFAIFATPFSRCAQIYIWLRNATDPVLPEEAAHVFRHVRSARDPSRRRFQAKR